MATAYADTSLIVAALTAEERTDDAQRWLARDQGSPVTISDWTMTEVAAALSVKRRTGAIGARLHVAILSAFDQMARESLWVEPVTRLDFQAARSLAERHASGLRAGDALHIAIAAQRGLRLVGLDKTMIRAATQLGVDATLL